MPQFHFYLIADPDREHIGTIELPHRQAVVPAGIRLTAEILASTSRKETSCDGWKTQATDNSGATVYSFNVTRNGSNGPFGYVH